MRGIDFSSWQSLLVTLIGLALFTLISIGIRLLMMFTIQQRRERMNRQINERLRTLIAAYKTSRGVVHRQFDRRPQRICAISKDGSAGPGRTGTRNQTRASSG